MDDNRMGPWSQTTKDRWFFGYLILSGVGVAYLFSPFIYTLMFAAVVVVVTWPIYQWVLHRFRGRRALAALLTTAFLAIVVFGPLGFLVYLFVGQAVSAGASATEWIQSGEFIDLLQSFINLRRNESIPLWIRDQLPEADALASGVVAQVKIVSLGILDWARLTLPSLLNSTVNASIEFVIFVLAVISLYMEGPRVLSVFQKLSPMDDAYEERLFHVFRELSNNLVIGSLATAVLQGIVASIGYTIAGVDRILFYGILTAVFSFVPVVGTVLVWAPLAAIVGFKYGVGWGVFLAIWSAVLTTQVDSVVRPLFMRGSTEIHPLLIFLAVFGGMAWMGLPGAMVGPVLIAFFLALYTIFCQDFLGEKPPPSLPVPGWMERLSMWWSKRQQAHKK